MMKTVAKILILSASMALAQHFINLEAPEPIQVKAPTEQSIREELKREQRLRQYKSASIAASQVYKRQGCGTSLAEPTGRIAVEQNVSPRLLAAVVFVESSCNPNAISKRGDVGLMQVNPIWHYSQAELKNPERNLYIGASILKTYLHRYGLREGLHAYNSLNGPENEYSEKVLTIAGIS